MYIVQLSEWWHQNQEMYENHNTYDDNHQWLP